MARKLHAAGREAVMLKLDITKAFDTVHWAFLLEILRHMGFGNKWTTWIFGQLASSSTRVLLNGIPGEVIYNRQGLRQGDPVSPLLFVVVMEGLQRMLYQVMEMRVLTPLAPTGVRQCTSIYADDVIMFIKADMQSLRACAVLLFDFGVASGLRTNLSKCSAHPI